MHLRKLCLIINGAERMVVCDPERDSLAALLRRIGLTGVKVGCGAGQCGACSVILDGKVVRSCTRKMKNIKDYSEITTIEGIGAPNYPHPLQRAWITYGGVQCGFCTPGFIVSAKGLLDVNPSPSREDVRDWFKKHQNICRCTGYKPLVDAVMAAARVMRGEATMEDITFKAPADGEYYGSALPRPAALAKVCGVCDYGDDLGLKMPAGTLHLAIVQPGLSHARIKGIDFAEAEKMPGVVKVITAKDIIACGGTNRINIPVIHPRSRANGSERPILMDDKVFRYGDVLAVVAAKTREEARAAARAVKPDLEPLPENLSYLDSVLPDAALVHDGMPNIYMEQPLYKGEDVRPILDNAEFMVEGGFHTQREPHLSVEPDIVQAYWGDDGMLTIHCKSQAIQTARQAMAKGIGVELDRIRVIENPTGASFGYATSPGSYALTAACAVILEQPVTLTMSYEEHQHFSGKRTPSYINARMSCDAKGKINALEFDMGIDHGPYTELAHALLLKVVRFMAFPYSIPNVTGLARMAHSNHNFGVAYRGFGSPQVYTCSESLVDMLAAKIGMDPFDFRYANIARPGDTNLNSYPFKQYPMQEIMDAMRPLYQAAKERARVESTPDKPRGVGLAWSGFNVTIGAFDRAQIALELMPDGSFTPYNTWQAQGQGGDIGALTLACEALKPLGVTPDKIRLVMNDSKLCPDTGISAGSRSHYMAGNATIYAADRLMAAMRKPDGGYRTHAEMLTEGIPTKYVGLHELSNSGCRGLNPNTGVGDPTPTYMYGLFMSEVEVDAATGKTKVLGVSTVGDVGVIANKLAVEGQAYGGISHCIGFALSEDYDDLKKHTNIIPSGVPQIDAVPDDIKLIHLENARPDGPFGSSGCSELYQSGGHMAVINAIKDATGVRIYELPATPAKVKAGLDALARGEEIKPAKYFLGSDLYDALEEIKANPV